MATATAVTFTAAATFATVFMTVIVAMTAAATVVVVIVVMIVRTMNVTVSQFLFGRFTNRHNFNVEFQILTSQHVVTVNHNVIVFNGSDFNRYWTPVGFSQKRIPTCSSSTPINTSLGTR